DENYLSIYNSKANSNKEVHTNDKKANRPGIDNICHENETILSIVDQTNVLSVVASVLSLTLIAYDRFFGIVFALKAHMTDRRARTSLILIWLSSALIACPTLIYRQLKVRVWKDHTERWCDDDWPVSIGSDNNITTHSIPSRTAYYATVSVVLYFIPMII
ncbi:G protein-coupled receptor 103, partial [Mytilus galloprovincialis]